MKNPTSPSSGKIIQHGNGTGVPSPDDVNQRARENARIENRKRIGKEDVLQARDELTGTNLPDMSPEESIPRGASRDPSEPVSDYGHEVPATETPDEQTSVEQLVNEGLEEAQHDQMIASRRRRRP
jgi:hypothetical protein